MMITDKPKVSVVVAVYNAEKFITDTINAVLNQTFDNFELILLDDCSSDNSIDIIKQFSDDRIHIFKNDKNLGISQTRNKLLKMAKGEYIAILDHDDICLPHRLEEQVNFLEKNTDIDMIGSWFELFCPKGAVWWRRFLVNLGWIWCHPLRPTIFDAWKGNVLMHPTMMFRREVFTKHNIYYREEYTPAEDYDLVFQALEKGLNLANIPKVLLKYALHGNNLSIKAKKAMAVADIRVKTNIAKLLNKNIKNKYPYWKVIVQKLRLKFMVKEKNV